MNESEMSYNFAVSQSSAIGCIRKVQSTGSLVPQFLNKVIPGELWGAKNVLQNALRQEVIVHSANSIEAQYQQQQQSDLDFSPSVDLRMTGLLLYIACTIVYACILIARSTGCYCTWSFGAGFCILAFFMLRSYYVEKQYQFRELRETELGDPDSKFEEIEDVRVHYKVRQNVSKSNPVQLGMHCYHGFGANVYSWAAVQKLLSFQLNAVVTAHDTPGFGLSERKNDYKYYSLDFNGRLGRRVLEKELDQFLGQSQNVKRQRVLVGHSLGGATAMVETVNNPTGIHAVVLIAPASVAVNSQKESKVRMVRVAEQDDVLLYRSTASNSKNSMLDDDGSGGGLKVVSSFVERLIVAVLKWALFFALVFVTTVLRPFLLFLLRKFVRSKKFWQRGLQSAYYDQSRLTYRTVDEYRKPKLVCGWEKGILLFTLARFRDGASQLWSSLYHRVPYVNLADKFAHTALKHNIQVIIIHGEQDLLVPAGNSRRLARKIPGCGLALIDRCGHMPQEEAPHKFVYVVSQFIQNQIASQYDQY